MLSGEKKQEIKYTYNMISILPFNTNAWLPGDFIYMQTHVCTHTEKKTRRKQPTWSQCSFCFVRGDIAENVPLFSTFFEFTKQIPGLEIEKIFFPKRNAM